jgi:M6 family metalloprotease-like protein
MRSRKGRWGRAAVALAAVMLTASLAASASAEIPPDAANHPLLQPIDAQNWVDQGELTWDAYTQIRPDAWHTDATPGSVSQFRGAVVLAQFTDQPFLISQAAGSHPFGNPQPGWQPVTDVRQWMHDYLTKPSRYNGGQTIHAYWMEDSHGKLGVSIDTYGPYTLPGKLHEYGIPDGSFNAPREAYCPQGDSCNKSLRTDSNAAWRAAIGCPAPTPPATVSNCGYDFVFYVSAGHDESSTWQEFGEMLFQTRDEIPDAFGPPRNPDGSAPRNQLGQLMPNWADTRYVDWTSWRAAANHWPNASINPPRSSTQAESSGQSVYAHEFSHILGLPDNYNNPFADNERNFTGYWEMMSRGTFNGPGGTHNRWQVPNQGGSGLGPHHMLHFKQQLGVLAADDQVTLQRDTLQLEGVAVVRIKARSSPPGNDLVGLTVDFGPTRDLAGSCENQGYVGSDVFYCPNRTGQPYNHYRVEVVDRVGNDSFAPGHGVLLSKSRTGGLPRVWLIDPNPQDIGMIDFYRPDGTPVPVVRGDPRQLNDATFHAGTNNGSEYEYVDSHNRLHFYFLAKHRDANGVLSYDVAVRRLDGAGVFVRGTSLGSPTKTARRAGFLASCTYPLTNTGQAGTGVFDSDVYRLSASSSSADWKVTLPNALAAAKAGQTVQVPVHVLRDPLTDDGDAQTVVTLTATSETDQTKTASRTCNVNVRDTTPRG